ncbi:MAG: Undecaprenyl-diphosphatase, partial [uncultured Friedmanniella sp.]
GLVRGTGAGHRARTDRVPAHLLQRAPVDRRPVLRRRGRRRRLHRHHPAGHRDRGDPLLPPRHRPDHRPLAGLPDRPGAPRRRGRPDGVAGDPRFGADRGARSAVRGRDRHRAPQPLDHRGHAGRLRPDHRGGRPARPQRASAELAHLAARDPLRAGAVAGPDPGRLPLGRHDQRRSGPRLHPRGRRPLLVPACHPGRRRVGLLQAGRHLRRPGAAGLGADRAGHRGLVLRRLRRHRLAAALHQHPHVHAVRGLPAGPRRGGRRAAARRGAGTAAAAL